MRVLSKIAALTLILTFSHSVYCFDISKYENANQLVWDDEFRIYVKSYFSGYVGAYFWDAPVFEQALVGLGGPPEDVESKEKGIYFVSGCRAQSCMEKVAYVTDGSQGVFGFVSYFCPEDGELQYKSPGCLIVFLGGEHGNELLLRYLKAWGMLHLKHDSYYVANTM